MIINRHFTKNQYDPYSYFEFQLRKVSTKDSEGKNITMEVEVPADWSETAAYTLANHYLVRHNEGEHSIQENSIRQAVDRMTNCWMNWGFKYGYFTSQEDASAFRDEAAYLILSQKASPNSPQWFNTGLFESYGIKGDDQGHFFADPLTGMAQPCHNSYEHPQVHACFIQSVKDHLVGQSGIMDLWMREARVFKFGSGSGSNFSSIRGQGEPLEGGGSSSGLISFLKVGDAAAGAIRSGGTTRRAAEMVCVDVDHPDIMDFIMWKAREEKKARLMVQSGMNPDEAYSSVSGQHSNNSVRLSDAFMQAMRKKAIWNLKPRVTTEASKTIPSLEIWNALAEAAWSCGDPGIQFDGTINKWNTCKTSGRINASNPCSEYMFLDDTACNLASLNLGGFVDEVEGFDLDGLLHATKIWTIVLDISVLMGQFPSKESAEKSWSFRTLGLGFTGLGSMIMRMGLPYDDDVTRGLVSAITSCMTGKAYLTSIEMALELGPFQAFETNHASMVEVMVLHRDAVSGISAHKTNKPILDTAVELWDKVVSLGSKKGFRNAQVTCIAPTGTIGLIMDSDTTGIEPLYAPVFKKKLTDGGTLIMTPPCIMEGMRKLGYDSNEIHHQSESIKKTGTLDKLMLKSPDHENVFRCATEEISGIGKISLDGHLKMLASVQPFISGAISKTVNLDDETTPEDISKCIWKSYRLGLKSVSFYREGSKMIQPIQSIYAIDTEGIFTDSCCLVR